MGLGGIHYHTLRLVGMDVSGIGSGLVPIIELDIVAFKAVHTVVVMQCISIFKEENTFLCVTCRNVHMKIQQPMNVVWLFYKNLMLDVLNSITTVDLLRVILL